MRTIGISILFIALFIALNFYAMAHVPEKIQITIKAEIENQYAQNSIEGIEVMVDGRDVTLHGTTKSQEQLNYAIELASSCPGVRLVMIEAKVKEISRARLEPLPNSFHELPEIESQGVE